MKIREKAKRLASSVQKSPVVTPESVVPEPPVPEVAQPVVNQPVSPATVGGENVVEKSSKPKSRSAALERILAMSKRKRKNDCESEKVVVEVSEKVEIDSKIVKPEKPVNQAAEQEETTVEQAVEAKSDTTPVIGRLSMTQQSNSFNLMHSSKVYRKARKAEDQTQIECATPTTE